MQGLASLRSWRSITLPGGRMGTLMRCTVLGAAPLYVGTVCRRKHLFLGLSWGFCSTKPVVKRFCLPAVPERQGHVRWDERSWMDDP